MAANLPERLDFEDEDEEPVPPDIDLSIQPTRETYDPLQHAFQHFNFAIFDGELPHALITLQRKGRSYGFFSSRRMTRADGKTCDEIALNPRHFKERSDLETLSTLLHEMVHLWQTYFGKPGRGNYHNREWAEKMKHVGLYPSQTGEPGGKETGEPMTHYILEDGAFMKHAKELIAGGFKIIWSDAIRERRKPATPTAPVLVDVEGAEMTTVEEPESKSGKRVKYTCPVCKLNAWSRHDAGLKCAEHDAIMLPS